MFSITPITGTNRVISRKLLNHDKPVNETMPSPCWGFFFAEEEVGILKSIYRLHVTFKLQLPDCNVMGPFVIAIKTNLNNKVSKKNKIQKCETVI